MIRVPYLTVPSPVTDDDSRKRGGMHEYGTPQRSDYEFKISGKTPPYLPNVEECEYGGTTCRRSWCKSRSTLFNRSYDTVHVLSTPGSYRYCIGRVPLLNSRRQTYFYFCTTPQPCQCQHHQETPREVLCIHFPLPHSHSSSSKEQRA
jgi:hypothetical protein